LREAGMKQIVVAVDLSEPSLRAVDLAADLAAKYDAELVLLTVGRVIAGPDPGMEAYARMEHIPEPVPTLAVESMHEGLAGVRDRAAARGVRRISTDVFVGDPAEQILACANTRQADLIALGSRGHGRLTGLLLGSVAQKVVTLAQCAVLVVH
jgi:nucleotide-binding universal stress UspA family protein